MIHRVQSPHSAYLTRRRNLIVVAVVIISAVIIVVEMLGTEII